MNLRPLHTAALMLLLAGIPVLPALSADRGASDLSSDSSEHDLARGIHIFNGNVSYRDATLALEGDRLEQYQRDKHPEEKLIATGTPATVRHQDPLTRLVSVTRAPRIEVYPDRGYFVATSQVEMTRVNPETGESSRIQGNRLEVFQSQNRLSRFKAQGNPARFWHDTKKPGDTPVAARAEQIDYEAQADALHLAGNAWFQQAEDEISAQQIDYFAGEKRLTIPKVGDKRVHIIQQNKKKNP